MAAALGQHFVYSILYHAYYASLLLATDHPASAGRLVLALGYSLKQSKYLLHGKAPAQP